MNYKPVLCRSQEVSVDVGPNGDALKNSVLVNEQNILKGPFQGDLDPVPYIVRSWAHPTDHPNGMWIASAVSAELTSVVTNRQIRRITTDDHVRHLRLS